MLDYLYQHKEIMDWIAHFKHLQTIFQDFIQFQPFEATAALLFL